MNKKGKNKGLIRKNNADFKDLLITAWVNSDESAKIKEHKQMH